MGTGRDGTGGVQQQGALPSITWLYMASFGSFSVSASQPFRIRCTASFLIGIGAMAVKAFADMRQPALYVYAHRMASFGVRLQ